MTGVIGSTDSYGTIIPSIVEVMTFLVYATEIPKEILVEVDSLCIYQVEGTGVILERQPSYSCVAFLYRITISVLEFGI